MWYALLDPSALATFGDLRNRDGLEASLLDDHIILRTTSEHIVRELQHLPCDLLRDTPDGLVSPGHSVPIRPRIPDILAWTPFRDWWQLSSPPTGRVTGNDDLVPLNLVRQSTAAPANALLTAFPDWETYAATAPAARLALLRFATSLDGLAWIEGELLPPLPGAWFTVTDGIACPAGWRWSPALPPASIRQLLDCPPNCRVILREDGTCEFIDSNFLIPATRENVRASNPAVITS